MSIGTLTINDNYRQFTPPLDQPPRVLLGAGPSNAHPRVMQAMMQPIVGHMDPTFTQVMDDIQELLHYAWQTDNETTMVISGTGSSAMEASLANSVEPGDVVVVAVAGYFGRRLVDMAERYTDNVVVLEINWGEPFAFEELRQAVETHRPQVLAVVHAETSTGVRQPLEGLGDLCREHDCLLLVDTVTSLGGVPLFLDEWGIDIAYSASQKCLGCPSGMGPITFGPRAMEKIRGRSTPIANWYMNVELLSGYWFGSPRSYHHTSPISTMYALREGLRLVAEEGLEARWQRHQQTAEWLWEGLEAMDLRCYVPREYRLASLTTISVPDGVDAGQVTRSLLADYNIEIAGGLGDLAGRVWRVGLMGFNSRRENVALLLQALSEVLDR